MKFSTSLAMLVLTIGTNCWNAGAQDDKIEPDRRDFTTGTGIVTAGKFQIESGALVERNGDARTYRLGDSTLRVPLSKRLELRAGVPYLIERDGMRKSGIDDVEIAARFLLKEKEKTKLALQLFSIVPTGSRQIAERRYQPGAIIALNQEISPKTEILFNIGGQRASDNQLRYTQVFAAASLRHDISEKVNLFAETYIFNKREAGGQSQKFASFGAVYFLNSETALDARFGVGLNNQNGGPDFLYSAGISHRF